MIYEKADICGGGVKLTTFKLHMSSFRYLTNLTMLYFRNVQVFIHMPHQQIAKIHYF